MKENKTLSGFVSVLILIFIVLTLIVLFWYKGKKYVAPDNQIKPVILENSITPILTTISLKSEDVSLIPKLPDYEWKKEQDDTANVFYLSDRDTKEYYKQIALAGQVYTREVSLSDYKKTLMRMQEYESQLLQSGGFNEKRLVEGRYELSPMSADGPTGESKGYLFYKDGIVQQVVVSYLYNEDTKYQKIEVLISNSYPLIQL
jgi:hypothetical protein